MQDPIYGRGLRDCFGRAVSMRAVFPPPQCLARPPWKVGTRFITSHGALLCKSMSQPFLRFSLLPLISPFGYTTRKAIPGSLPLISNGCSESQTSVSVSRLSMKMNALPFLPRKVAAPLRWSTKAAYGLLYFALTPPYKRYGRIQSTQVGHVRSPAGDSPHGTLRNRPVRADLDFRAVRDPQGHQGAR